MGKKLTNKVYVCVSNDLSSDQRVHKISTFIKNQNYEVHVIGRKLKNSLPINREYNTKRIKLMFNKGPLFYACLNIRLFFYLLTKRINILVSNDLDTLLSCYLISKIKRVKLIYDSHEYFTETPELINRPMVKRIWLLIEESIFPKLKYIYTVNQSIQEIYQKKYNKVIKVIRNVSPIWNPQNIKSKKELGLPEDKPILILQGAGINIDRGAEELVESMINLPQYFLLIIGSGDVFKHIKNIVKTNNLNNVLIIDRLPYLEMMNYTFHADLGISLDKKTNLNYLYSLPNKVFDYIQAGTPILSSNVIEVSNIINKYSIGTLIEEVSVENITKQLKMILENIDLLLLWKRNVEKVKLIENWENEQKYLEEFYVKMQ
ncbi:MAG: glycosyltransferase [Flavobacteriia bacterium]|nr:glycosyltransferase [Flavobacteriia bacterium]